MKKTILLITDSIAFDKEYIEELKKSYNVKVCGVMRAIQYVSNQSKQIGLVIFGLDNGVSLYQKMLALFSKIPAIFWTKNDDEATRKELEKIDNGYLVKPELESNHLSLAVFDLFGTLE